MKHLFHFSSIVFLALSLTISVNLLTACGKGANSVKDQSSASENDTEATTETSQTAKESMKAPDIKPDASGLIRLSQCPTTYDKMEVAVSEDNTTVTITYDGEQLQTLSDAEDGFTATGEDNVIHFMDANFDGYVDIFIGPGESRTYSALLIWDATAKQFKRVGSLGDPSFQNVMLYPSDQFVFEGGSSSWCSDYFTRSIWEGDKLKTMEELVIVNDPEQYGEYEVENKYTLRDNQEKATLSTDDISQLPATWKSVVEKYGNSED
jgi:hypothetical protein